MLAVGNIKNKVFSLWFREINTGDIINILGIYGNGGHNEAHYKYFDTIEKCDEAFKNI